MEYVNFDLWIGPAVNDRYLVRARTQELGGARGHLESQGFVAGAEDMVTGIASFNPKPQLVTAFGAWLYGQLFAGEIGERFQFSFEHARRMGQGIRLRLEIEPPELAAIPWELLYYPAEKAFIAALLNCPLVRCPNLARDVKPLKVEPPLNTLVCIPAVPASYGAIDVAAEKARILESFDEVEGVKYRVLEGRVTRTQLVDSLLEQPFHCLHFIGHGEYRDDTGFLVFNREDGGADHVEHDFLAAQLRNHPSLRLAFLNCCESGRTSARDAMAGLAPRLIESRVPAVLAMQLPVSDAAAVRFAREFYRSLFRGANSGCVDYAVSHARCQVLSQPGGQRDFAAPALYLLGEGILFTGDALEQAPEVQARAAKIERRIRLGKYLAVSSFAILVACFAFWVSLFDILQLDSHLEGAVMRLGDPFVDKELDQRIALVIIDRASIATVGREFGPSWRALHAEVLQRLSKAGARVIAFDLHFGDDSEHDIEFANAIAEANARGTQVVLGFRERTESLEPVLSAMLAQTSPALGVLCYGGKLGKARSMPVLIEPSQRARGAGEKIRKPLASLSLAAYMAAMEQRLPPVIHADDWDHRQIVLQLAADAGADVQAQRVPFSESETSRRIQKGCPAIREHDRVAQLILNLSPLQMLREPHRRFSYATMLKGDDEGGLNALAGKTVLIGVDSEAERFEGFGVDGDGSRLGVELHADALNALLRGEATRALGAVPQLLIMILLGALAATLRFLTQLSLTRWRLPVLAGLALTYLFVAVFVYARYLLMMNVVYHLFALLASYRVAAWVERRRSL